MSARYSDEVLHHWMNSGYCDCNPAEVIRGLSEELFETRRMLALTRQELQEIKEKV